MKPCEICKNKNIWCGTCKVNSFGGCSWNYEPIQPISNAETCTNAPEYTGVDCPYAKQPAVRKLTIDEFNKWMEAVHSDMNDDYDFDAKRLRIGIELGYIEPEPVKTALQKARENYINKSKDECDREEIIDRAESYITELEKAIRELKEGDRKNRLRNNQKGNRNIIEITTENDCPDDVFKNIEWYIKEFSYFIVNVKIIKKDDK